ncbi:AsmA family protein [Rhizobacter sp. J219]|uniref:AsmA family protein n=1 Tax=Rhizobacter sp. J219 TaxID=2898430 RepID=UPI002151C7E4|nr:AsmA family protein [Rhizobacter sp. J219]MCR5883625.1 AsmA family protein [Rhizobacter sp. J219]
MMSPWMRKLLIGAGVFVLLIAAVLTYLVATFDPNAYKGLAVDWMKTHRQRTLVIDGPIKLAVFPRLAVEVSRVKLSEKNRLDEFLSLDEAALSVAVLPLLRQQVVVDSVRAKGLRVLFQRDAKGGSNLDDFMQGEPKAEPSDKSSTPLRFDVSSIQLEDLRLSLRDEQGKLAGDISLASLTTGRLADGVESPVKLKARLGLTAPAVQGDLDGSTQLKLDLANKGVTLKDMALAWKGKLPGTEAVDARLRGTLALDGANGTMRAEKVELVGDAGLGTLRLVNSSLTVEAFAYDPGNQALQLGKLRIKLGGTSSGHPLNLNLDWPELVVQRDSLTGSPLSGQLSLAGPTSIDASFKTAAPSGSFERIVVPNVESTLKGRSGPRNVEGTVRATLLLQPAKGALALEGLNTQLQLHEPSLQPLAVTLQGTADASSQVANWALKGQINGNPYTSEGKAILATTPMTLNVTARFDSLDLNRLLPPSTTAPAASGPSSGGAAADTPVDLSALRSLQGKFDLKIGQFAYQTYRIADVVFAATLDGGMLRVSQLSGKAWGGSFVANAFADARASRLALAGNASGVNVNALLKDVAQKDILEGTGRVVVDVDSAGRSVNELKSRLQGKAALQLRDGAIKGVNLAKSLRQARATLGLKGGDEVQKANRTEKTDFSELSATFAIHQGVARNNDLDMKSPFLRLGGDGALDIGKGRIDYTARATVASTSKGQDGADLAALKGLTIPVHLTGPFEAMDWRIRWSAITAQALKTEVGGKLEQQAKDRLRDKLGLPGAASPASGAASGQRLEDAAKDKLKDKLKGIFK